MLAGLSHAASAKPREPPGRVALATPVRYLVRRTLGPQGASYRSGADAGPGYHSLGTGRRAPGEACWRPSYSAPQRSKLNTSTQHAGSQILPSPDAKPIEESPDLAL